jgi:hypothetical protein
MTYWWIMYDILGIGLIVFVLYTYYKVFMETNRGKFGIARHS